MCVCHITCCYYFWAITENDSSATDSKLHDPMIFLFLRMKILFISSGLYHLNHRTCFYKKQHIIVWSTTAVCLIFLNTGIELGCRSKTIEYTELCRECFIARKLNFSFTVIVILIWILALWSCLNQRCTKITRHRTVSKNTTILFLLRIL